MTGLRWKQQEAQKYQKQTHLSGKVSSFTTSQHDGALAKARKRRERGRERGRERARERWREGEECRSWCWVWGNCSPVADGAVERGSQPEGGALVAEAMGAGAGGPHGFGRGSATGASGAADSVGVPAAAPDGPEGLMASDSGSPTSFQARCKAIMPAGCDSMLAMARSWLRPSSAAYLGSIAARIACRIMAGSDIAARSSGLRSISSRTCGFDSASDCSMAGFSSIDCTSGESIMERIASGFGIIPLPIPAPDRGPPVSAATPNRVAVAGDAPGVAELVPADAVVRVRTRCIVNPSSKAARQAHTHTRSTHKSKCHSCASRQVKREGGWRGKPHFVWSFNNSLETSQIHLSNSVPKRALAALAASFSSVQLRRNAADYGQNRDSMAQEPPDPFRGERQETVPTRTRQQGKSPAWAHPR
jgi:hypothetical protein